MHREIRVVREGEAPCGLHFAVAVRVVTTIMSPRVLSNSFELRVEGQPPGDERQLVVVVAPARARINTVSMHAPGGVRLPI